MTNQFSFLLLRHAKLISQHIPGKTHAAYAL